MKLGHRFVAGYKMFKYGHRWYHSRFRVSEPPIQERLEARSAFREYKSDKAFARMLKWEFRI